MADAADLRSAGFGYGDSNPSSPTASSLILYEYN